MLIALLVNAIPSSLLGKAYRKVKGLPVYSFLLASYRKSNFLKTIKTLEETVSTSYERSALVRAGNKLCPLRPVSQRDQPDRIMDLLTSPWLFPIALLAFFWAAQVRPSPLTLLLLYTSVIFSAIFILISKWDLRNLRVSNPWRVILFLGLSMLGIGVVGFVLQVSRVKGFPLLNEGLRRGLSPILNYMAWTSVPGVAFTLSAIRDIRKRRCLALALALIGFIPSLFLAFRTEMIAYVLAVSLVLYRRGVIKGVHLLLGFLISLALFVGVGAIRSVTTGVAAQPVLSVLYRPTITVAALDTIVRRYSLYPVTHGLLHLAALSSLGLVRGSRYGPRTLISIYTLGRRDISTTATILGGPVLDAGLLGALFTVSTLSYLISLSYRASEKSDSLVGPYATLLSYTVVGVETGILDLNVYLYLLTAAIVVILSLRPRG